MALRHVIILSAVLLAEVSATTTTFWTAPRPGRTTTRWPPGTTTRRPGSTTSTGGTTTTTISTAPTTTTTSAAVTTTTSAAVTTTTSGAVTTTTTSAAPTTTTTTSATTTTTAPTDICSSTEHIVWFYAPEQKYYNSTQSVNISVVTDVWTCAEKCLSADFRKTCKSFTFIPSERTCELHPFRSGEPGVVLIGVINEAIHLLVMQWECRSYNPATLPQYCTGENERFVFIIMDNIRYDKNTKNVQKSTRDQCEAECMKDNTCHSVNFREKPTAQCSLNLGKRISSELLPNEVGYIFVEKTCVKDPITCGAKQHVVWFAHTSHSLDTDKRAQYANVPDFQGCETLCLYMEKFVCKAVEYKKSTKTCILFTKNSTQVALKANNPLLDVYEWKCMDKKPTDCLQNQKLEWNYFPKRILDGHDDVKIAKVANASMCQQHCQKYTGFVCLSVEYNANSKVCTLSSRNRAKKQLRDATAEENTVHYFEWTCDVDKCPADQHEVWYETLNEALHGKFDEEVKDVVTLYQCQILCQTRTTFRCRAIEYSNKTLVCRLSRLTAMDAKDPGQTSTTLDKHGYVYLEWRCQAYRPPSCNGADSLFRWRNTPKFRDSGNFKEQFLSQTQAWCEEKCIAMNSTACQRFNYRKADTTKQSSCEIFSAGSPVKLREETLFTHQEQKCALGPYNPCQKSGEVFWESFLQVTYSNKVESRTENDVISLAACEALCLKTNRTTKFNCIAVEYKLNQTCLMFNIRATRVGLKNDADTFGYFERKCRSVSSTRCQSGLVQDSDKTTGFKMTDTRFAASFSRINTFIDCQTKCYTFPTFKCFRFDYNSGSRECILYATEKAGVLVKNDNFNHYELKCKKPGTTPTSEASRSSASPIIWAMVSLLVWLTFSKHS